MSHPGVVGEDPNHIGATLDLGVEPFEGTGRPDLLPVVRRGVAKGRDVLTGGHRHLGDERGMTLHHGGDLSWPTFEVVRVELGEDRAVHDRCHGQVTPGHPHEHVAHEVDRKAWPTSPGIDFGDGRLQPEVGIADDELDATESSATKRPQELGPRGDVLGLTNGDAQNLASGVLADTGGGHDRPADDPFTHASLDADGASQSR